VTVLGLANDATVTGAVLAAKRCHGKIMVDLMGVVELTKKIPLIEELGADYLCIHTAIDGRNSLRGAFANLMMAKQIATSAKLAIAGGLNVRNIADIVPYAPDIVIVGAGITAEADKAKAAAEIKQKLCEAKHG
jgi:3-hexulose-6-phosphate synthase